MIPTKVVGAMLAPILIAVALGGAAGTTTDGSVTKNKSLRLFFSSRRSASYKLTSNSYV